MNMRGSLHTPSIGEKGRHSPGGSKTHSRFPHSEVRGVPSRAGGGGCATLSTGYLRGERRNRALVF